MKGENEMKEKEYVEKELSKLLEETLKLEEELNLVSKYN